MFKFIFLFTAIVFVALDFMYLNLIKGYFSKQIAKVQGEKLEVNFLGAAICYIFLIAGLNYFIIEPKKSVYDAFLLGIVIYGVYETTNYSLFKNWSILTVLIDTLWGGVLFASTTFLSKQVRNLF
jgi:uncharacterized membrane protein